MTGDAERSLRSLCDLNSGKRPRQAQRKNAQLAAAAAQSEADFQAEQIRVAQATVVAARRVAAMLRYNESDGSSYDGSSSDDRHSRKHRRSSSTRVGSKENRTFGIDRSDRKAWYDTLVPYLRGHHTIRAQAMAALPGTNRKPTSSDSWRVSARARC